MDLIKPSETLEVVRIDLSTARPTNYLKACHQGCPEGVSPLAFWYMNLTCAGASDYLENKLLDHSLGKASFTMPTTMALALCTVVPTDSSTGATIVEINYTCAARKKIEAAALNAAASGKSTTSAIQEYPTCTAGSSTVVAWAACDSSTIGAGNALLWGTTTSIVISTSATPASINSGGFEVAAD
jgi:hypothetical protein